MDPTHYYPFLGYCLAILLGLIAGILIQRYLLQRRFQTKEKKILDRLSKDKRSLKNKQKEIESEIRNEIRRNRNNWDKEKKKSKSNILAQINKAQANDKELFRKNRYFDSQIRELEEKIKQVTQNTISYIEETKKTEELMLQQKDSAAENISQEEANSKLKELLSEDVINQSVEMIEEESSKSEALARENYLEELSKQIKTQSKDFILERAVTTLTLPDDKMKGQIIGREGRNIRSFEQVTGANVIVDETPSTVLISSFSPLKKELAKRTIEHLVKEGKINPQRIEEVYKSEKNALEKSTKETGLALVKELGLHNFHPNILRFMGSLQFHSFTEKVALLDHIKAIVQLSELLSKEQGINPEIAKRAAFLHQIGRALDYHNSGSIKRLSLDIAKKYNESETVLKALREYPEWTQTTEIPSLILALAVQTANDRPGSLPETLKNYLLRQNELEDFLKEKLPLQHCLIYLTEHYTRAWLQPTSESPTVSALTAREVCTWLKEKATIKGPISTVIVSKNKNHLYHTVN